MPTGKSEDVSTSCSTYVYIRTGILNRWHSGYSSWKLWPLNKLAYLPKDPIVAICTDGDATQLAYLILGKKLASELSTAPVCMLLSPTKQYKVATFISISSSCEATLHCLSTDTSEFPSGNIQWQFSKDVHIIWMLGTLTSVSCTAYMLTWLATSIWLVTTMIMQQLHTPSDYIKCS